MKILTAGPREIRHIARGRLVLWGATRDYDRQFGSAADRRFEKRMRQLERSVRQFGILASALGISAEDAIERMHQTLEAWNRATRRHVT